MGEISMVELPVIDISASEVETGRALVGAAEEHGFVFIKNKGQDISVQDIDKAFQVSKDFFASQKDEKLKYHITANNMGWSSPGSEVLDPPNQKEGDFKEAFNMGEFRSGHSQQPLPPTLAQEEQFLAHFEGQCHKLCNQILDLFAIGLEIPDSVGGKAWFSSRHDPSKGKTGTIFRLLYYPYNSPSEQEEINTTIRAGAHSDYGSITLLFQRLGQPGLEIQGLDGSWSKVPVTPAGTETDPSPPILVNIGDLLSYWTGGLLRSTVHRVTMPQGGGSGEKGDKGRYSIAYFCHPVNDSKLVPVPSERVRKRGTEGANALNDGLSLTAEEHLKNRLASTYGWKEEGGRGEA